MRDPYETLGIPRNASEQDVRDAFRRLAREHHPDRNPGDPGAERRFQEINAAHQVLGDPARRARYDRIGASAPRGGVGGRPGFSFEELFAEFFSGFVAPPIDRGDLQQLLDVTFEEAALGCTKSLRYLRNDHCPECEGSGAAPSRGPCPACRGARLTPRERQIEIALPAGIENGASQSVPGAGHRVVPGRPPGDLELVVRVTPHPHFRRESDDVHSEVEVPFTSAALGGEIAVATLHGETALRVPPGTQHGDRIRLRGQGVPHRFRGGRGDHLCRVKLVIPNGTSARTRQLVEELARVETEEEGLLDRFKGWFAG